MSHPDRWLAGALLSVSLLAGSPVAVVALADSGGGGHGGNGGHGGGHGNGSGGPGSSHAGSVGSSGVVSNARSANGNGNSGFGAGASGNGNGGVGNGNGKGNVGSSNSGGGPGSSSASTSSKPASQSNSSGSNGGGAQPPQRVNVPRPPVTVGDGRRVATQPPKQLVVLVSVARAQTVMAAPVESMTISIDTHSDSRNSGDDHALSMIARGMTPIWEAAQPKDLQSVFFGLTGLVLMPLAGLWLGYRQARAQRAADQIVDG